jgi:hypothetical protein
MEEARGNIKRENKRRSRNADGGQEMERDVYLSGIGTLCGQAL